MSFYGTLEISIIVKDFSQKDHRRFCGFKRNTSVRGEGCIFAIFQIWYCSNNRSGITAKQVWSKWEDLNVTPSISAYLRALMGSCILSSLKRVCSPASGYLLNEKIFTFKMLGNSSASFRQVFTLYP